MAEVVLDEPAVLTGVRQMEAAAVPELVGMNIGQSRSVASLAQ